MVVEARQGYFALLVMNRLGTQVDPRRDKFFDHRAQYVGIQHGRDFIPKFEFKKYLLNVGGKSIEVGVEIGFEFSLAGTSGKVAEIERGSIAESLTSTPRSSKSWI